jgi:poly(3-hydroxybutyrate) depolymerase
MKTILSILALTCVSSLFSQGNPLGNEPFPSYTPFLNQADIPENSRPYYAIDSSLVEIDCPDPYCENAYLFGTIRYAFGPGRSNNDGNSSFDLYYASSDNSESAKPLAVLLHGNGANANKDAFNLKMLANELVKRGYVVIIPDYTTASDDKWGGSVNACFNEMQLTYVIQQSVRDVRAAIRRILFLSTRPQADFHLDPSNIFIVGLSYGSITAAHLAFYDIDDFPHGGETVSIEGETYSFSSSLDDISICGNPNFSACTEFAPEPNYDVQENISGVSLFSPFLLDTAKIDYEDATGVLMFQGTCDAIVPFDSPTMRELFYRRVVKDNDGEFVNPAFATCANEESLDYKLYGSFHMHSQIFSVQNPDFYRGYFRLCGMDHGLNDPYLNMKLASQDTVYHGLATYETIRFFSNILNDNRKWNFVANLDHSLHPLAVDSDIAINCNSVPRYTDTLYTPTNSYLKGDPFPTVITFAKVVCPDCDNQIYQSSSVLRLPSFRLSNWDNWRYPPVSIPECDEPASITIKEDEILIEHREGAATSVKVIDQNYRVIKEVRLNQKSTKITGMLVEEIQLKPGTYFLHFDNGEKQAIVVHD